MNAIMEQVSISLVSGLHKNKLQYEAAEQENGALRNELSAANKKLATVEALLRRWLEHHTKAAGLSPPVALDRNKFAAFLKDIEQRDAEMIEATIRALTDEAAAAQEPPVRD